METPPVHNMIVQWERESAIFFNVFDTKNPFYSNISNGKWRPTRTSYDKYYAIIVDRNPHLYIPVKSTTIDELRLEHPELFI